MSTGKSGEPPFHAEHIGSLLRPPELKAAYRARADGEFRRGSWFLGFVQAVEGLSTKPALFNFSGEHGAWECAYAHGPVKRTGPITVDEYKFVRAHTRRTPKVT